MKSEAESESESNSATCYDNIYSVNNSVIVNSANLSSFGMAALLPFIAIHLF